MSLPTAVAPSNAPASAPSGAAVAVRRGAIVLFDQGVLSGASFVSGLLIARAGSPAELGRYTIAWTLVLLLMEVQGSLLGTPYMVARPRLSGARLAAATGAVTVLQGVLAAGAAMLALFALPWLPEGSRGLAGVLAVALLPLLLREHLRRLSFAGFELGAAARLDLVVAVAQVSGLVALAAAGRLSAEGAVGVMGVAAAAGAAVWWRGRPAMVLSRRGAVEAWPGLWREGRWMLASGIVWAAGLYAYPWVLAVARGSADAGLWAAGMGLASLANPALTGVGNYLGPRAAHAGAEGGGAALRSMVLSAAGGMTLLLAPLAVAALLWGERAVAAVYGAPYAGTGPLVFLLTLHLWMTALAFPVSRALFTLGRAEVELQANGVALAVLLAAGVWLTIAHGVTGAAAGLALSGLTANVARGWRLRRLLRSGGG